MMLASFPTPSLGCPVLYRATDEDALRQVKATIRDLVATVHRGIEAVEGGVLLCGSRVFEIRHVGPSPRPGFVELHLRLIAGDEPESSDDEGGEEGDA